MQAIILAGGLDTKLQAVTGGITKPMAPIAGRPFMTWLLEYIQEQGISDATLCLHHLHHSIPSYFGLSFCGMRLRYSVEKFPLGTGGAIQNALKQNKSKEPLFVLNGDSLVQVDYRRMRAAHHASGKKITMATTRMDDCSRYGQLTIENNTVSEFMPVGQKTAGAINAGMYLVSPQLFEGYALPKAFSFEREFLAPHVPELKPAAYSDVQYFIDIGIPKDYLRGQQKIPERLRLPVAA